MAGQKKVSTPPEDKLPPHSYEAERGVLACIILSPSECLPICIEQLKAGPKVFYDVKHQLIYKTLLEMWEAKEPIDNISIVVWLTDMMRLPESGGLQYLTTIPDATSSHVNLPYYLKVVLEKFMLRSIIIVTSAVGEAALNNGREAASVLDGLQQAVISLSQTLDIGSAIELPKPLSVRAISRLQELASLNGKLEGLPTGFQDFDYMTGGMRPAEMVVIAARPSQGKTAIAMNIVDHVAVMNHTPVAVFSLEMTAEALMRRMICSRAKVSSKDVRNGHATQEDIMKLVSAQNMIGNSPIYIDGTCGLSIVQIRSKAKRYQQQFGIKLVVIDYLQMIAGAGGRENRQQEVTEISRGIKGLAKELSIPVIVLAQLNREMDKDKNRKPRLSDLRESGAIEQDADIVGFLYKKPMPDGYAENPVVSPTNLLIAKQRDGEVGDIELIFFKSYTKFESASKIDEPTETQIEIP